MKKKKDERVKGKKKEKITQENSMQENYGTNTLHFADIYI